MTHLLGAKELQSFVAYSLIPYDYAYGTKADHVPMIHQPAHFHQL
jgi:hypothetical protein